MTATERQVPVRDRLLQAADRLFYAEGIHAVGIDRVVAQAHVAKRSLYVHFDGKDALVEAYLERRSADWRAHVEAELPGRADDAQGRVLAVFELLDEWFAEHDYRGCPFINAGAEFPAGPVAAVIERHRTWVHRLFTDLLGKAGHHAVEATARQLSQLYDGAMVSAQLDGDSGAAIGARRTARLLLKASSG